MALTTLCHISICLTLKSNSYWCNISLDLNRHILSTKCFLNPHLAQQNNFPKTQNALNWVWFLFPFVSDFWLCVFSLKFYTVCKYLCTLCKVLYTILVLLLLASVYFYVCNSLKIFIDAFSKTYLDLFSKWWTEDRGPVPFEKYSVLNLVAQFTK